MEILDQHKNSRGEILTKIVRVTNKHIQKGLEFDLINELYHELLIKYKAENILIIAKAMDGNFVTLKSQGYFGDNLKHADPSYFDGLAKATPKQREDIKKKIWDRYYEVQITIQC